MLTVPTYIGPSSVHGLGLFAAESIKAGTVMWQYHPAIDYIYDWRRFRHLCLNQPENLVSHLCAYTYKRNNRYYYITDNARFINHTSGNINIAFLDDHHEVAIRDIAAGEEILEDYFESYDFDDFFNLELHGVDLYQYLHVNERARKRLCAQHLPPMPEPVAASAIHTMVASPVQELPITLCRA